MQQSVLEEIKRKSLPILKEASIKKAALFGSYVRGEQRDDSDIDMLVELPQKKSLLDLVRLQRKLEESIGKSVDLLTYNSIHPLLKASIQKDQLVIL